MYGGLTRLPDYVRFGKTEDPFSGKFRFWASWRTFGRRVRRVESPLFDTMNQDQVVEDFMELVRENLLKDPPQA